jgi:hypothetical protein
LVAVKKEKSLAYNQFKRLQAEQYPPVEEQAKASLHCSYLGFIIKQ